MFVANGADPIYELRNSNEKKICKNTKIEISYHSLSSNTPIRIRFRFRWKTGSVKVNSISSFYPFSFPWKKQTVWKRPTRWTRPRMNTPLGTRLCGIRRTTIDRVKWLFWSFGSDWNPVFRGTIERLPRTRDSRNGGRRRKAHALKKTDDINSCTRGGGG